MTTKKLKTFKIEKDVGPKYTILHKDKDSSSEKGKNIDLVLNTCTREMENALCSTDCPGVKNKKCRLLGSPCPYLEDKKES